VYKLNAIARDILEGMGTGRGCAVRLLEDGTRDISKTIVPMVEAGDISISTRPTMSPQTSTEAAFSAAESDCLPSALLTKEHMASKEIYVTG